MANPLIERAPPAIATVSMDLREWCSMQNERSHILGRWYWVQSVEVEGEKTSRITATEGFDADEIRGLANGRIPDYYGWPREKMDDHIRKLQAMMRRGMTEFEYEQWLGDRKAA